MDILSYIKQERKRAKISQEQAGKHINVCTKTYAGIENGTNGFSLVELQSIMELLGMEIYVVTGKIHK